MEAPIQTGADSYAKEVWASSRSTSVHHRVLRWLEHGGVLVVIAVLAGAQPNGMTVTDLMAGSELCNATLYSALSLCIALELVTVSQVTEHMRRVKRYALTDKGFALGGLVGSLELAMVNLTQRFPSEISGPP